ncbi:MAG: HAMP domain-containing sensor histidine kinase [Tissierellia bacterium]|nr:HAMP domain-containing sensor histidine kinase [Tissierellia bacterium]
MEIKGKSLKLIFFEYLISVGLALIVFISIALFVNESLFAVGFIVPSNYTENLILENKNEIAESESFDNSLILDNTYYMFLKKDGKILDTNMDKNRQENAIQFHNGKLFNSETSSYIEIARGDGIVIINYSLMPYYSNKWVRDNFPSVNVFLSIIIGIFCILAIFIVTLLWADKVSNNLKPMLKASEKIAKKDLNFKIESTNIKEFNRVLDGLNSMKIALGESLKKEWVNTQNRKNQISALTHDLKTPLSIVQGNAELLKETDLDKDQEQLVDYIIKNSKRLTDYISTLILVNKTDDLIKINLKEIDSKVLVDEITQIADEICIVNNRKIKKTIDIENKKIMLDLDLIERAIGNVLANAMEYSPAGSDIELSIIENDNFLEIKVMDNGKGFSKTDLVNATEEFYRGDNSRNSSINFGMGLFIADKILNLHNGKLLLSNKKDHKGAVVTLKIPINQNI